MRTDVFNLGERYIFQNSNKTANATAFDFKSLLLAIFSILILSSANLFAQTRTLTGSGTIDWSVATNWVGNIKPTTGNNVIINASGGDLNLINVDELAYGTITFNSLGGVRTITMNTTTNTGTTTFGNITVESNIRLEWEGNADFRNSFTLNSAEDFVANSGKIRMASNGQNGTYSTPGGGSIIFNNFGAERIGGTPNYTIDCDITVNGSFENLISAGTVNIFFAKNAPRTLTIKGDVIFWDGVTANAGTALIRGAAHTTAGDMYHRIVFEGASVNFGNNVLRIARTEGTGAGAGFFNGFDLEFKANAPMTVATQGGTGTNAALQVRDFIVSGTETIDWTHDGLVTIYRHFVNSTNAGNTFISAGGTNIRNFSFEGGTGSGSPQLIGVSGGATITFPHVRITGDNTYVRAQCDFNVRGNGSGAGNDQTNASTVRTFQVAFNAAWTTQPRFELGNNTMTFNSANNGTADQNRQQFILNHSNAWVSTNEGTVVFAASPNQVRIPNLAGGVTLHNMTVAGSGARMVNNSQTISITGTLHLQSSTLDFVSNTTRVIAMQPGSTMRRTAGSLANAAAANFVCPTGTYNIVYDGTGAQTSGFEWVDGNDKVNNVWIGPVTGAATTINVTRALGSRRINGNINLNSSTATCFAVTGGAMPVITGNTLTRRAVGTLAAAFNLGGVTSFNVVYANPVNITTGVELSQFGTILNNLTVESGAANTVTVAVGTDPSPAGNLTINSGTLILGANTINRQTAGGTLSIAAGAGLRIGGTNTFPANYGTVSLNATSTVEYNGTAAQTIGNQNYGNLIISQNRGSNTITLPAGTIDVAGTFTASLTNFNVANAGNTFNYSGADGQQITSFPYNNLSSANNNRVLQSTGTIGVAGIYTPGTGTYTVTGSTVNFNGTSAQTVPAKNYHNLTVSGDKGSNTVAFSGAISIANIFSLTATNVSYQNTGSTISFVGSSQSVPAIPVVGYNNLTIQLTSGNATMTGSFSVAGTLALNAGKLILNGNTLTIGETGAVSGTFSGTEMVDRASGGSMVKQFNNPTSASFTFPLGTGANYTPFILTGFTATGTGSVSANVTASLASSPLSDPTVALGRAWVVGVSGLTVTAASAAFNYVAGDVNGNDADYIPNVYAGGSWVGPAGTVDNVTRTISAPNVNAALAGEWTAGEPPAFLFVTIYYSLGGDWNTPASWSTVGFGGPPAALAPIAIDQVRIGDGQTITVSGAYVAEVAAAQIQATGTLEFINLPNAANNLGVVTGSGLIRFTNSSGTTPAFPAGDFSNFTGAAGGTIEYGGTGGYTLPSALSTYRNFTVSGTGTKTLNTPFTANGNVTVSGILNVTGAYIVLGNMVVDGTWNQSSGSLSFNRAGVQSLGGTGTINLIDLSTGTSSVFSNTASYTITGNLSIGNNTSATPFTSTAGTATFNGAGVQNLTFSGTGNPSLFNVTLGANTQVQATANNLRINGNIVNNSTGAGPAAFYASTQPVTLLGGTTQTLTGGGTREVRFIRLTIGAATTFAPAVDFRVDERITNSSNAAQSIAATGGTAFVAGELFGTGTGTVTYNNLQLEGRLDATGTPSSFSLTGNLINNTAGTGGISLLLASPSTVSFIGSSAQSIGGTGTGSLTFHAVTIAAGARVNSSQSLNVRSNITNNSDGIGGISFNQTGGTFALIGTTAQALGGTGIGSFIVNAFELNPGSRVNVTNSLQINADLVNNSDGISSIAINQTVGGIVFGGGIAQTISGTGTGAINMGTLTIGAGTTLNNDKSISIGGDVVVNSNAASALNCTDGTITFNGGITQTITGPGTGSIQFNNITIAAGVRLNMAKNILVSGDITNGSNGIAGIALDGTGFSTTFNNGSIAQVIAGGGTGTRQFGSIVIAANSRLNPAIAISYAGDFTNNSDGISGISYGQTNGGVTFNGGVVQTIGGTGSGNINMLAFTVAAGTRVNCSKDLNFGGNNSLSFNGAGLGVPAMVFDQTAGTTTLAMGGAGQSITGTGTTGGIRFFNLTFQDGSPGNYQINRGFDVVNNFTFNRTNSYGLTFNRLNGAQTFNFNNVIINANNMTNAFAMQAPSGANVSHTMNISGDIDIQGSNASPFSWNTVATSGGFYNQMQINLTGTGKTITGAGSPTVALNWSHVTISGSYTNNYTGEAFTIGDDGSLAPVSFTNGGTGSFTMGANTTLTLRVDNADFSFPGATFNASATGNTIIHAKATAGARVLPAIPTYHHLTFAFAGATPNLGYTLAANTQVNGDANLSTLRSVNLSDFNLTIRGALLGTPFSSSKMLVTNGTGSLIKVGSAAADFITPNFEYPLGTGSLYTPMILNALNAAVVPNATIAVRAVPAKEPNVATALNVLSKYWTVATTGITLTNADVLFQYNASELGVPGTNYIPVIRNVANTQWIFPTGATAPGVNPMGATATTVLEGNWTAGQISAFSLNYYSIANGDWNNPATWSIDDVLQHAGAPATTTPTFNDVVFVGGGFNVNITNNNRAARELNIAGGSTLALGATNGHDFGNVFGTGTLSLASGDFPLGTFTSFVSPAGGTVDYTAGIYVLPNRTTYNNLTISGAGGRNSGANLIINGDLSIGAGATFDLSADNHTVTLNGSFSNAGTYISGTGIHTFTNAAGNINSSTPLTINSLTISSTGNYTSAVNTFNIPVALAGTGALALSPGNTLNLSGTVTLTTLNGSATGSTVNYDQASAGQLVRAATYFNLTYSNFNKVLPAGTISVLGTYTPGTATHTVTGNTIDFIGSAGQIIPASNYNNIANSNNQDRVLANAGTIFVANSFNVGTGAYTTTGSTVNYNAAAGAQTIADLEYNNLTVSNTATNRTWTLAADRAIAGTLTIADNAVFRVDGGFNVSSNTTPTAVTMTGGQFQLLSGSTFTCNGTFTNTGGNFPAGAIDISFPLATSVYVHNRDGGNAPIGSWGSTSTFRVTGITGTPFSNNINNNYGIVEINAPLATTNFGLGNGAKSAASIDVINTGSGFFHLQTSGIGTTTITGNFTIGGSGQVSGYNFGGPVIGSSEVQVGGIFTNNGVLDFGNANAAGGNAALIIRVTGNATNTGTLQRQFGANTGQISMEGGVTTTFTQNGTMSSGILGINKSAGNVLLGAVNTSISGLLLNQGLLRVTGNQTLTYTGTVSPIRNNGHVSLDETGTNLFVWQLPPSTTGTFFAPLGLEGGAVTGYRPVTVSNVTTPAGTPSFTYQYRANPGTATNASSVANTAVGTKYYLDLTAAGGAFSNSNITLEVDLDNDFNAAPPAPSPLDLDIFRARSVAPFNPWDFIGSLPFPGVNGPNSTITQQNIVLNTGLNRLIVGISNIIDLGTPREFFWTGLVSNDWNNNLNWDPSQVPNFGNQKVTIPVTGRNPVYNGPSFSLRGLTIAPSAGATINAGFALDSLVNISGTLTVNGAFTLSGNGFIPGILNYNGTGGTTNCEGFIINNTAPLGVVVNASTPLNKFIVRDSMRIGSNVQFNLNGASLTLRSTAAKTARISAIPTTSTLSGATNVTVQRHVPSNVNGWYFLSTPIQGQTYSDWADNFYIALPLALPGITQLGAQHASIFTFDGAAVPINGTEPTEVNGWRIPTNGNVNVGNGYRVWLRSYPFLTGSKTFDNTGTVTQGDYPFSLSFNASGYGGGGWNFLGNPYPSAINWDATAGPTSWTKTNVNNAIYVWDGENNVYMSYVGGIGANGGTAIIPSSQGFFVNVNSGATLIAREGVKFAGSGAFKRIASENTAMRITLLNNNGNRDEAVLRTDAAADANFDGALDAYKLPGMHLNLGIRTPLNEQLSISTIPALTGTINIPLTVNTQNNGTHRLQFSSVADFTGDAHQLYLKDNYLNVLTQITEGSEISFDITQDAASKGDHRFELLIFDETITDIEQANGLRSLVYPNPSVDGRFQVALSGLQVSEVSIELYDALGKRVAAERANVNNGTLLHSLQVSPTTGVYYLRIAAGQQVINKNLMVK